MRILYLNHNYRYAGTFYRAMPMAERMVQRGHQVTLLTVSQTLRVRARWCTVNGVRIGELPNWGQNNGGNGYGPLDNLHRIVHALIHRYDIVHMFDHKPNATFAGFGGRLRRARLVADWSDWWGGPGGLNDVKRRLPPVGAFEAWWEVASKRWADGVTTISTVLLERALAIGCKPERVIYLPTGARTDRIQRTDVSQARAELGIPATRLSVGYIGGLSRPALEMIMRALVDMPDVWLTAIGPSVPDVRSLAQSFGIGDRLWQTGFINDDDVSRYLGSIDIACIPMTDTTADRGRLPNKLLDYLAAGRPVIAGPVGDVRAIVEQNGVGLLVNTATECKAAFEKLFGDASLREQMGQTARNVAETIFDWRHLADLLDRFYTDVVTDGI